MQGLEEMWPIIDFEGFFELATLMMFTTLDDRHAARSSFPRVNENIADV